ncbi:MAG: type II toxin-antitoxin system VapC family toxin [Geobacteraceae bacterium]
MKRYFFDTSALVKIYHREAGSDYCLELYADQSHIIIISELARVELHSAIFRKRREKELNAKALKAVLQRFEYDCEERYEVLHVASLVYDEACRLLSSHVGIYGLRTLDSLQLAAFLNYCEKDQDCFVCADRKLSAVVEQEGVQAVLV